MKHRNPLRQGEWLVCPLNSAGRELAVRETKEFYSWENLLCCAELPDLFLWKSPFLRKQNTLMLPNCPKGFCICQRKHGNQLQQRLCQTNPLSCCVFSLFLSFPSWHFLNSLLAMLRWPIALLPVQISGHSPISSTAAATPSQLMEKRRGLRPKALQS